MKSICFCNSNIPWGGGEKWHLDAALSLASRGWRVFLMCHPEGALHEKALPHTSLKVLPWAIGRLSFLNPFVSRRLSRFFATEQLHAVIMNLPADLKCIGPAAKRAKVPHIIFRRGSAIPVRDSFLNRFLYGSVVTGVIANSEATRRTVLQNNPRLIPINTLHLLPNGIDVAAFDHSMEKAAPLALDAGLSAAKGATDGKPLEQQAPQQAAPVSEQQVPEQTVPVSGPQVSEQTTPTFGPQPHEQTVPACGPQATTASSRPILLGTAGRLNKQKAQHYLLYLGAELQARGQKFHIIIAGTGEREEELRGLAERLGIKEQVYFAGFMADLSPFWQGIDIFVLTSLWEGFGYVLLEAMLARKPILAFAVSNIPELVAPGENGLIFPLPEERGTPDMTDMADAVCRLAENEMLRVDMGREGRAFAQANFSQEACMDRLEALLQ